MQKTRDNFIDIIKIYACVLVVLGHFFPSMTESGIVPATNFFQWFDLTVYYFHVPLFFICSGYLFQKYSKVNTFSEWKSNIIKKFIALGVPYLVFSTITWVLKTVFSSSVNMQVQGYFESIFLAPISPYWYLYALILVFFVTLTFGNKKVAYIALSVSLVLKVITFLPIDINVYAVDIVMQNEIWFVIGMCLCYYELPKHFCNKISLVFAVLLSGTFIVCSILFYTYGVDSDSVGFIMGVIACTSTVVFAVNFGDTTVIKRINAKFSKHTMPVFLMHTIFAAGFRAVLIKFGIINGAVHIVLGLIVSFAGPIIAAIIMDRIKWLNFVMYPNKYIKLNARGKNNG